MAGRQGGRVHLGLTVDMEHLEFQVLVLENLNENSLLGHW